MLSEKHREELRHASAIMSVQKAQEQAAEARQTEREILGIKVKKKLLKMKNLPPQAHLPQCPLWAPAGGEVVGIVQWRLSREDPSGEAEEGCDDTWLAF